MEITKKLYGVYDTWEYEACIGLYTCKEIMKMLNITEDGFYKALRRGSRIKHRYEVVDTGFKDTNERR